MSLRDQEPCDFEVVVVDNAASSDIRTLVSAACESSPVPITYVSEPKLGLHHARHSGARSATGEVLVFTDDDATFERDWLIAYEQAFTARRRMAAAGGPVRPVWESPPPEWLVAFMGSRELFPILSLMELKRESRVSRNGIFLGVNMAICRDVLFEVGGFSPEAFGDTWLGNGETGLNHKLWTRGHQVGYVPDAVVYHHIPRSRMTLEYFRRRMYNEGACDMYTRFHRGIPGRLGLIGQLTSIVVRNCVFWLMDAAVRGRTDFVNLRIQLQAERAFSQLQYVRRLMGDEGFRQFVTKQDWLNDPCTSE
jgi:glucosyl-dolichyl phosphate glucuronosyltransferase